MEVNDFSIILFSLQGKTFERIWSMISIALWNRVLVVEILR